MADEVSAALLGEMRAALALKTETDARIGAIRKKLTAKTATQADIADYADRLGELLRDTLRETLTPEALPNETLYYNILRDTVGVMLKNAHRKVNEAAIEAQKAIDEAQGLHLNAEAAPYPQKRADDLFYKVGAPGTPYETAMKRLAEPVATLTRAFHDDHIRHNADVRFRAGMGPKIVRTAAFNCCEWCSSLAGTYDYEDVRDTGNDVFRRHERCKCIVDYVCDGKSQAVWSKKYFEADEETLRQRMQHRLETKQKTPAEMDAEFEAWQKMKRADEATLERRKIYRASIGDTSLETLRERSEYGLDAFHGDAGENEVANGGKSDIINREIGSSLFSSEAKKRLYENERIISGNSYETSILYDADGNVVFRKKGTSDEVSFTGKQLKKMSGGIITHNHPKGSCFSEDDVWLMHSYGLTEMRTCTSKGTFVLRQPNKWPKEIGTSHRIEKELNRIRAEVLSEYGERAEKEGIHVGKYYHEIQLEIARRFAESNHLEYYFEEV